MSKNNTKNIGNTKDSVVNAKANLSTEIKAESNTSYTGTVVILVSSFIIIFFLVLIWKKLENIILEQDKIKKKIDSLSDEGNLYLREKETISDKKIDEIYKLLVADIKPESKQGSKKKHEAHKKEKQVKSESKTMYFTTKVNDSFHEITDRKIRDTSFRIVKQEDNRAYFVFDGDIEFAKKHFNAIFDNIAEREGSTDNFRNVTTTKEGVAERINNVWKVTKKVKLKFS